MKVLKSTRPEEGTTHRVTVVNEQTGEVELDFPGTRGGFIIINDEPENPFGTKQTIFGALDAIAVCVAKCEDVIMEAIKAAPQDVSDTLKTVRKLYADLKASQPKNR